MKITLTSTNEEILKEFSNFSGIRAEDLANYMIRSALFDGMYIPEDLEGFPFCYYVHARGVWRRQDPKEVKKFTDQERQTFKKLLI